MFRRSSSRTMTPMIKGSSRTSCLQHQPTTLLNIRSYDTRQTSHLYKKPLAIFRWPITLILTTGWRIGSWIFYCTAPPLYHSKNQQNRDWADEIISYYSLLPLPLLLHHWMQPGQQQSFAQKHVLAFPFRRSGSPTRDVCAGGLSGKYTLNLSLTGLSTCALWGRLAHSRCELNLPGHPCGIRWFFQEDTWTINRPRK